MAEDRADSSVATVKERFDLLYERLKAVHDTFIDVVFKATAAFLIVTGWVVTSDSALSHLRRDPVSRWLAVIGLLIYAALYAVTAYRTARFSGKVSDSLAALAYVPADEYSDLVVRRSVAYGFAGANAALCTAVGVFIFRIAG
jgi:hypothetical protein